MPPKAALQQLPHGLGWLALDYEVTVQVVIDTSGAEFTELQRRVLLAVDRVLSQLTVASDFDPWTEDAFLHRLEWQDVRDAAHEALNTMGWAMIDED